MRKMVIFEPAMCCSTGVCGPSVNPELLRVSTVINNLRNKGIFVKRYNLANSPQMFVDNREINKIINGEGIEVLPVTIVDNVVVKKKGYPTNEEFCTFLGLPADFLRPAVRKATGGCDSSSCG